MLKKILLSAFLVCAAIPSVFAQRADVQCDIVTSGGSLVGGVYKHMQNGSFDTMIASGNTVPTDGSANYAKGGLFFDRNVATGISGVYVNNGTADSCQFINIGGQVVSVDSQTAIAISGTTTVYTTVPTTGVITGIQFASTTGIATSSTNYYNFAITNLGLAGAGTLTVLNSGSCTTKGTDAGGLGTLGTNTVFALNLSGTSSNLVTVKGDRLKIDVGATGTPVNTLTHPSFLISFGQ